MNRALLLSMQRMQIDHITPTKNLAHLPSDLYDAAPAAELWQSLPSQVEAISPFVDQLMVFIAIFREADGSELEIEIALREALINAAIHGNHEDPDKILSTHGRGIYVMRALMDEVCFEKGGSVVHMRKKPSASSAPQGV